MSRRMRIGKWFLPLLLGLAWQVPGYADDKEEEEEPLELPSPSIHFDDALIMGEMGATPGGAQDIGYFRDRVKAGEVPHPNTFTPEGLFSEHDLPLVPKTRCTQLICVTGQATAARLVAQADVRYLAQLGFSSGLDPKTFRRDPLNLVAVVDTSGSMGGDPLITVRESLLEVAGRLGKGDQLSIVRYSDKVEVVLPPTPAGDRDPIRRGIQSLRSIGSTNMEAGLALGFEVAKQSADGFQGTTRVMLFTDERPNVGRTDAKSFMGMAEAASKGGVGLTTIGVGTHFGAELATRVSSVRGGNLFFFPDVAKMKQVFADDFDTMVTELAYDMDLELRPARGFKIAGVYGIPGDMLNWGKDGSIRLGIATIFLSKRKGAIYVALASDTRMGLPEHKARAGTEVVTVDLGYVARDGKDHGHRLTLQAVGTGGIDPGLLRGRMLVNQVTALKEATRLHHEKNDQESAYQLVKAIATLYRSDADPDLANERELVFQLERTLAKLSGHHGEPDSAVARHPVTGLPPDQKKD